MVLLGELYVSNHSIRKLFLSFYHALSISGTFHSEVMFQYILLFISCYSVCSFVYAFGQNNIEQKIFFFILCFLWEWLLINTTPPFFLFIIMDLSRVIHSNPISQRAVVWPSGLLNFRPREGKVKDSLFQPLSYIDEEAEIQHDGNGTGMRSDVPQS